MNGIVIYDTKFGNTQKVAEAIAQHLKAEVMNAANVEVSSLQNYDFMVFGCPTHAWNMSAGMKVLFKRMQDMSFTGKRAAAFDTKINNRLAGSAAKKIENKLKNLGFTIAIARVNFFVTGREGPLAEGELDKIKTFTIVDSQ